MPRVIPATPGHLLTIDMWFRDAYYRTFKSVMYYKCSGGTVPTYTQLSDFIDTYFTNLGGEVDDILDHDVTFAQCSARYENNEGVDLKAFSAAAAIAGNLGDVIEDPGDEIESLPPFASLCIRKFTYKAGRANRGHLFIPFVSEQIQHDGIVDTLNYTSINDILDKLLHPLDLAGLTLQAVHWNRKEAKLVDVLRMGALQFISSRKDRKFKEPPFYVGIAA